jgi:hypothetical protein
MLYLAVPASILLFLIFAPRIWRYERTGLPTCDAHAADWARRRRIRTRWLWPPVAAASLAVQAACLTGLILHPALYAHTAAGVVFIGFVIDVLLVGRREVGIMRAGPENIRLIHVHQSFVDALTHERARDRVDNPERRVPQGDMRVDYDDEVS